MLKKTADSLAFPARNLPISWLAATGCLIILLRFPNLGHLLAWDEAWNLCALNSLAAGNKLFFEQFWRHPPIYMGLGFLLAPLKAGFALRMELLSLLLSTAGLLVFLAVVARLYGRRLALYTGIAYSLLPGAIFFDTWIKRDPAVTLFGSLALLAFINRKHRLSSLFLGLGLLSKETAIFYVLAIMAMASCRFFKGDSWQKVPPLVLPALLIAGGWYLFLSRGTGGFLAFFRGETVEAAGFSQSWFYYFSKLPDDLGWGGAALAVTGLLAIIPHRRCSTILGGIKACLHKRLLPLYLLLPGYLVLSLSSGKPPWMTIPFYPVLALLTALGWTYVFKRLTAILRLQRAGIPAKTLAMLSVLLLTTILGLQKGSFAYAEYFKKIAAGQYELAATSYEMVAGVNELVRDGENLLILPMLYRNGPLLLDPIFTWNLTVSPAIHRSREPENYETLKQLLIDSNIQWLLMSPVKGSRQEKLYDQLVNDLAPLGRYFSNGILIRIGKSD